jgi:phage terminase large subunit
MPKATVKIKSRVFNQTFRPYLKSRQRYELLYGGAGSGKSYFIAQRILVRAMQEKGHKTLVVRKVARTNRHSTFALIKSIMQQWKIMPLFKVNKSDMEITCRNGNQIIFTGLDDVEKLKSIAGITDIWVEEASEITQEDFTQLDLRLRGKSAYPMQITLSFNPISALSWIKAYFFDSPKENSAILKTTYKDNEFLDEEYKQVIEDLKNQDATYYQIYALGEWGVLGNLVFTNYVFEDIPYKEEDFDAVYQGLDFGFNHPSAFIKVGFKDDELYVFDELYEKGLTNAELIDEVAKYTNKKKMIIADSAEPARIKEFRQAGFNCQASVKGKGSVKDGIDWLKRKKIHISKQCPNLLAEMQQYSYKEDKDGNVQDEPVEFKDDAIAALRYAIEPVRRRRTITAGRNIWG